MNINYSIFGKYHIPHLGNIISYYQSGLLQQGNERNLLTERISYVGNVAQHHARLQALQTPQALKRQWPFLWQKCLCGDLRVRLVADLQGLTARSGGKFAVHVRTQA